VLKKERYLQEQVVAERAQIREEGMDEKCCEILSNLWMS